jgi:hypothetical protein
MEPLKALTLLATAGVVSLVGAGAAGFYAGYSAGRGNLEEIKAQIASAPATVSTGAGGTVSLKPVLEDIRALSKQVEALAAVRSGPTAATADTTDRSKPLVDEIKALARQVEALKGQQQGAVATSPAAGSPDYSEALQDIRDQIKTLNVKFDKQEPKAAKPLIDEIRSLSASVQAQEPLVRRAIGEEVRSAVSVLQNAEPKVPKALLDEVRTISANVRTPDARPQASVVDQIKILTAAVEALKSRLPEDGSHGSAAAGADVDQIRQLVMTASEQFGRCQTQLASLAPGVTAQPAQNSVLVSQTPRQEPSTVVFYDNVMLKKDQEKQYDEIGVHLSLQSVAPRQVKLAINRQGVGLSFGERKVFRSQDVECELNLMETNLNDSQARVSISCKR